MINNLSTANQSVPQLTHSVFESKSLWLRSMLVFCMVFALFAAACASITSVAEDEAGTVDTTSASADEDTTQEENSSEADSDEADSDEADSDEADSDEAADDGSADEADTDVKEAADAPSDTASSDTVPSDTGDHLEDMRTLLQYADPMSCMTESDGTLHCILRSLPQTSGVAFSPLIYVEVPKQSVPVNVVELPLSPPSEAQAMDSLGEQTVDEIRQSYEQGDIMQAEDSATGFKPARLMTNFAVVTVDPETGEFDGRPESVLSDFDPPIEVRLEFHVDELMAAVEAGYDMPRFGYWSYAFAKDQRKWVEFTLDRDNAPKALIEFLGERPATRGMAGEEMPELIEVMDEATNVDHAIEMYENMPRTRGVNPGIRAILIEDVSKLVSFIEHIEATTPATRSLDQGQDVRISFIVTVSSWEDQALGSAP
ncbi:MAG: hypothetical protein AAF639_06035 [Chloroflexota bacterium]